MRTLNAMMEWSAVAIALYATLALVLPVQALAGLA
jgi:hypothetical protein